MTKPQQIQNYKKMNKNLSCVLFWYIQGTVCKDRFLESRRRECTLQEGWYIPSCDPVSGVSARWKARVPAHREHMYNAAPYCQWAT